MPENRVILKHLSSVHFPKLFEVLISFLQVAFLQLHPIFTLYSILVSFNQIPAGPVVFNDIHKCLLFSRKDKPLFWNIQGQIFKGA